MSERAPYAKKASKAESAATPESHELFRATIGFDFIFVEGEDGKKKALCVELNGEQSGIGGLKEVPPQHLGVDERLDAAWRDERSQEYLRRADIAYDVAKDLESGVFPASRAAQTRIHTYMRSSINKVPMFPNAVRNPIHIERITGDKKFQERYIPAEYRPRVYAEGGSINSSTGFWIVKGRTSRGGRQVYIVENARFRQDFLSQPDEVKQQYVAQEFYEPLGAEKSPEGQKDNPASMRLLMDFAYQSNGTVKELYTGGYMRVSPYAGEPRILANGKPLRREDIYVVNKTRGAEPVGASDEEMRLAKEAALAIIGKFGEEYGARVSMSDLLKAIDDERRLRKEKSSRGFAKEEPETLVVETEQKD